MISNLLLRLSAWNPQLFREVKGRLKPRSIWVTVTASVLVQSLILLYMWVALPGYESNYSRHCLGKSEPYSSLRTCVLDAQGYPTIDWPVWWFDIFQTLSWLLPFVLLVAGVYMLIGDLAKEERRGTLNFIRLSPQTSQSILVGKLLGVPLVPILGVLLAIPLHVVAAAHASVPVAAILSIYITTIAACCCFYSGAIFYSFLGGVQSWLGSVIVWVCYSVFFQVWYVTRQYHSEENTFLLGIQYWYYLMVGSTLGMAVTFVVSTFAIATFWIWQAINRRYRNPNRTLISKRQSYLVTLCFEVFIFGFAFYQVPEWQARAGWYSLISLILVNLAWFVCLIASLTPHRQTLLDWARYRRNGEAKMPRQQWHRLLFNDLVWGEKSPAVLAIALNTLIPMVLFTPWIFSWQDSSPKLVGWFSLLFTLTFILICAAIAQLVLLAKFKKRSILTAGILGAMIVFPPIAMSLLGAEPSPDSAILWMLSAFAFAALEEASAWAIGLGLAVHLSFFVLLTSRLTLQLRKAGESEMKALMAHRA